MKYLFDFWNKYRVVRRRLDSAVSWKDLFINVGLTLLLTALWCVPIIIMLASLTIFVHLQVLAAILILTVIIGTVFAYNFTYYWILKKRIQSVESYATWIIAVTESTIIDLLILIIGIIFVIQLFGRV